MFFSDISGRLLIGQNDSVGVLLLDICIEYKKGRDDLTGGLLDYWINWNALI